MEQKEYPRRGCEAANDVTGCRFALAVMSCDFVPLILESIKNVNTEKVWSKTDALSTIYRGKRIHVMDCLKALFSNANDGKTHITLEAAVSKGCSGNADNGSLSAADGALLNNTVKQFNVLCKTAFYPLGIADYMEHITHITKIAKDRGLLVEPLPDVTVLKGDVNDMFDYFGAALAYAEQNVSRYVLQISLSANSPSAV
ncbi:MAG: Ykof family thiamine-binding protein [Treponema sp.]|nr:Ykof family thiamine-binding protein [Treponema sp.]